MLKLTQRQIEMVDRADLAIKIAWRARSGLLCGWVSGDERIDMDRLETAGAHLSQADAEAACGDWAGLESHLAWALHYAKTCGAPNKSV